MALKQPVVLNANGQFELLQSGDGIKTDYVNHIPIAGDIPSPNDGDIWYNSTLSTFRSKQNGVVKDLDLIDRAKFYHVWDECLSGTTTKDFTIQSSGTGAGFTGTSPDGFMGVIQATTGTTNAGRGSIAGSNLFWWRAGHGYMEFNTRWRPSVLSTVAETWTGRWGFIDSITAESTDAIMFRYTNGVNSGKFEIVTRANSVETAADSGITVVANTSYNLKIIVNAAGTSVDFYINGTLVGNITTNIPNSSGRVFGYGNYYQKTNGTTSVSTGDNDFVQVLAYFATAR